MIVRGMRSMNYRLFIIDIPIITRCRFTISNVKDLELLLMQNRKYAAEVAHGVSARKRRAIIERADELNVKVINRKARLTTEESE